MMLDILKRAFTSTVYVQLREAEVAVFNIEAKSAFIQPPFIAIDTVTKKDSVHAIGEAALEHVNNPRFKVINPFSHPRLLVADFLLAERILMHALREVHNQRLIKPSPIVVMHPLEKLDGGITRVECKIYRELALGAGARAVHVHQGKPLDINNFRLQDVCEPSER